VSEGADFLAGLFATLAADHGINFSIFHDPFDRSLFLSGIRHTLYLSIASIAFSIVIGAAGAYVLFRGHRLAGYLVAAYVSLFRNTPPLIQLYFFYFALGPSLTSAVGTTTPVFSNITWAIVSLTLYAGAFNVEIFRAGVEAVPKTTLEAADSLGMSRPQQFMFVVAPLAWRISMPALNNNLVNLMKTTTNAYAIAVPEVLYAASQIWADHLNALEMMIVLLVFYTAVIGAFIALMHRWERALKVPGWGRS